MVLNPSRPMNERETLEFVLYLHKHLKHAANESETTACKVLILGVHQRIKDEFNIRILERFGHVYFIDPQGLEVAAI